MKTTFCSTVAILILVAGTGKLVGQEAEANVALRWLAANQCQTCHPAPHGQLQGHPTVIQWATPMIANALGVEAAAVDDRLRAHLKLEADYGVLLASVPDECEGAKAGLRPNDIVLRIGDQPVNNAAQFNELVGNLGGKTAQLAIIRQGQPLALDIATAALPANNLWVRLAVERDAQYRIGVTLSEADDALRSHLHLPAGEGLVVTEVVGGGPAETAGVKVYDVMIELDGVRLTTVDATNSQIQAIMDRTVELRLFRGGQEVKCQVQPAKSSGAASLLLPQLLSEGYVQRLQNAHPALAFYRSSFSPLSSSHDMDAAAGQVATQIAELKRQLNELQVTVQRLEAFLTPPTGPSDAGAEQK